MMSLGQFMNIVRKRIELGPKWRYFYLLIRVYYRHNQPMANLYNQYKNDDGLLEIQYCGENTFGFSHQLFLKKSNVKLNMKQFILIFLILFLVWILIKKQENFYLLGCKISDLKKSTEQDFSTVI